MTGAAQRIRPGGLKEVGPVGWVFARVAGVAMGSEPPKLFLTLGRTRGLFWGWLHFAGRLMPGGKLPRRETELVILRVAHLRSCDYEMKHHLRLSRRAGITDEDVHGVMEGPAAAGWSSREAAILSAVDAIHESRNVDDAGWAALRRHLSEREAVELCLLATHYEMLATVMAVLRISPDEERSSRLGRVLARRGAKGPAANIFQFISTCANELKDIH